MYSYEKTENRSFYRWLGECLMNESQEWPHEINNTCLYRAGLQKEEFKADIVRAHGAKLRCQGRWRSLTCTYIREDIKLFTEAYPRPSGRARTPNISRSVSVRRSSCHVRDVRSTSVERKRNRRPACTLYNFLHKRFPPRESVARI